MKKYQLLIAAASAVFAVSAFGATSVANDMAAVGAKQLLIADDQAAPQAADQQAASNNQNSTDQNADQNNSDNSNADQSDDTDTD